MDGDPGRLDRTAAGHTRNLVQRQPRFFTQQEGLPLLRRQLCERQVEALSSEVALRFLLRQFAAVCQCVRVGLRVILMSRVTAQVIDEAVVRDVVKIGREPGGGLRRHRGSVPSGPGPKLRAACPEHRRGADSGEDDPHRYRQH